MSYAELAQVTAGLGQVLPSSLPFEKLERREYLYAPAGEWMITAAQDADSSEELGITFCAPSYGEEINPRRLFHDDYPLPAGLANPESPLVCVGQRVLFSAKSSSALQVQTVKGFNLSPGTPYDPRVERSMTLEFIKGREPGTPVTATVVDTLDLQAETCERTQELEVYDPKYKNTTWNMPFRRLVDVPAAAVELPAEVVRGLANAVGAAVQTVRNYPEGWQKKKPRQVRFR